MCDFFWKRMENNDQGDLADIVRASGGRSSSGPLTSTSDIPSAGVDNWQFPTEPMAFQPLMTDDFGGGGGDRFANLRDPLLHELAGTAFFDGLDATAKIGSDGGGSGTGGGGGELLAQKILLREEMKRPCNLFSRVLQISPGGAKTPPLTPRAIKPSPIITGGEMVKVEHGVQISSPRTPGIKRRKSQAKKVVCIPAPAAASSRPSGEVVPSDLWAWRKYGQKPIKGSPYPRGYYRCSSSKGCSARKQVERSRTDPNMLVITYTSEHNHPWPTQRNALAGSTRSQPSKNSTSASKSSPHTQRPPTTLKEEPKETTMMTSSSLPIVKEEVFGEMEKSVIEASTADDHEFDQLFYNEPVMAEPNQSDDFFADLAELEPDPMSLIFSRSGFIADKSDEEERERNKGLDSFVNIFDWGGSSFGDQPKKGL